MKFALRDYQAATVEDALERWAEGVRAVCYAAPTGSGKSVVELAIQAALAERGCDAWIVTPRVEIVRGMLDKLGVEGADALPLAKLVDAATRLRITTPVRLRNTLERQSVERIDALIIDEVHHSTALTYDEIRSLTGRCPVFGLTATPYRGTPRGTLEFRALWGEPVWILTLPEAVERGVISAPTFRVAPLVDDDLLDIVNGDFVVKTLASAYASRLEDLADVVHRNHSDRPTMVSLPSTEIIELFHAELQRRNVASVRVVQKTKDAERRAAFAACLDCSAVLLQINVVSEGVDLPIRRLIDASPTMSPVRWMQQVGRITRPGGASEYICTNRNMERHGYLWSGAVPPAALKEAVSAFAQPSMRSVSARVVGLESLGKIRPAPLPLADGMTGAMYAFQVVEPTGEVREYVALIHPLALEPFFATRVRGNALSGYGKWAALDAAPDVRGASARSLGGNRLSDKQAAWWRRSARAFGLDAGAEINAKQFQALPVLADCGVKLWTT